MGKPVPLNTLEETVIKRIAAVVTVSLAAVLASPLVAVAKDTSWGT